MARAHERVFLQDGLKLDLNRLSRKGFIKLGANIGSCGIRWTHSYWGEDASGMISADMSGQNEGWLRVQLGNLDQTDNHLDCPPATFRRQAMVLHVSG